MADDVAALVQEVLSAIPAGCTWLLPVPGADGAVVDFTVAATSDRVADIYGRGASRRQGRLAELYPTMVDGPLWKLYLQVLADGVPGELSDFVYADKGSGVVAESHFRITVHRVLGGLLVWWQRSDEAQLRMERTELLGSLGWTEYDLITGRSDWSAGMYRIFGRDPADGPLNRTQQQAAMHPEDRGLSETAWQTLDSGATSDVTVRFRIGTATKHLRILSDAARDADGAPVKIYAVVQDVTARVDSRSALETLAERLRTRETTALAEHRLAAQLQHLIQPVPVEPIALPGLQAVVGYFPAEKAVRVGGDWWHAQTLPDGTVLLAVGDVAGHGLEAANGMAHLRFALVAWLSIGIHDPGALLGHLNQLCVQLGITGTAVVARHDPTAGRLGWARAGHPPPLSARAGAVAELPRPPGLLLGAEADTAYPVAGALLNPDDLVLFYTDGLVERRAADSGARLAEVRKHVAAVSANPGQDPLVTLRGLLHEGNPDDDTCLLAVRVKA
ncbi:PP2C family protein-serine/threonine phosphatase [Actinoplanes sp. NPDC051859]|uniref:PP2C family protein-serine/threonine phosphatase n=1 Tax=Actinoplanes sp. NPDC051859 TaxID=3363909 RepID=UPI0037B112B7